MSAEQIRFRGTVQGVGFRPAIARLARAHGLRGWVRNDADGVVLNLGGSPEQREAFLTSLMAALPPLARVEGVERSPVSEQSLPEGFTISPSQRGAARTAIAPDAATCPACAAEIHTPLARRFSYPFTNCTHCGPRYSIVTGIPYDRASTTMAAFELCAACALEYGNESDRRYHAQAIACVTCGPHALLLRSDGRASSLASNSTPGGVAAVSTLIKQGQIVAIKGLGGYHLCCDATNEAAVAELRRKKRRPHKPLAMMARDLAVIARYAEISPDEEAALTSPQAPVVLLEASGPEQVARSVAPGQRCLGFMLPYTPLHLLALHGLDRPMVCTSGNIAGEPPCVDDDDALQRLGPIAPWFLSHNRPIANRVDDSVVRRVGGQMRILRRSRGYAPATVPLHPAFSAAPPITALGAHLKATIALMKEGDVVLSPHIGDLDEPQTIADYLGALERLSALMDHAPQLIAVDAHPGYRSTQIGEAMADAGDEGGAPLKVYRVGHHHAHIAACMAEHGLGPGDGPVLGIALDGLGYGEEEAGRPQLWGGEIFLADFCQARRLASLPKMPLLGGDLASTQPWRNLYAHLACTLGWETLQAEYAGVEAVTDLLTRRHPHLDRLLGPPDSPLASPVAGQGAFMAPRASSCGRLFDAVAAALNLFRASTHYEGQAAIALETLAAEALSEAACGAYAIPLKRQAGGGPRRFDLTHLWRGLLGDLAAGVPRGTIAARFHGGLAQGLIDAATELREAHPSLETAALSGGVWQNRILTEAVMKGLGERGWRVLTHRLTPPNDGCIALGQAAIAATLALREEQTMSAKPESR